MKMSSTQTSGIVAPTVFASLIRSERFSNPPHAVCAALSALGQLSKNRANSDSREQDRSGHGVPPTIKESNQRRSILSKQTRADGRCEKSAVHSTFAWIGNYRSFQVRSKILLNP
jgi:hypothetical protein